jgi:hypothetical protein
VTDHKETGFKLPVTAANRPFTRAWLLLGIAALTVSGLFSVMLVASRSPGVQDLIPWIDFFHIALIIHVDLSVVIWFLCIAGVLWTLNMVHLRPRLHATAWLAMATGTLIIALSPFFGAGNPVINNYLPVLDDPLYFTGLITLGAGFLLLVLNAVLQPFTLSASAQRFELSYALHVSAFIALLSLLSIAMAWFNIPPGQTARVYYELLFWGGGHTMQFSYTVLLAVCWLYLCSASGCKPRLNEQLGLILFSLLLTPAVLTPVFDIVYPITSYEHHEAFTSAMRYGGLAVVPLMIVVLMALPGRQPVQEGQQPLRAALYSSLLLFTVGGVLGFLIAGKNVVIPAHYHGSIVGVTLAFMGISYDLLPRLGFGPPLRRVATWQPYVYGGGQLLHILGLAWSGGYGVQRKTAGAAQGLEHIEQIAGMAIMGLGGLIAIIGGLMFVIVAIHSIVNRQRY